MARAQEFLDDGLGGGLSGAQLQAAEEDMAASIAALDAVLGGGATVVPEPEPEPRTWTQPNVHKAPDPLCLTREKEGAAGTGEDVLDLVALTARMLGDGPAVVPESVAEDDHGAEEDHGSYSLSLV